MKRSGRVAPRCAVASFVLVICFAASVACGRLVATRIGDILDHPRDYDGKTVTVEGEVTDSTNLLVVKYYVVKDDTGEIHVVTDKAVPRKGEKVRVTGQVNQQLAIGDKSLVVIRESGGKR